MDKPTPPMSLQRMLAKVYADRQALYLGPGAFTADELAEYGNRSPRAAKRRAVKLAAQGELVEVQVEREDAQGRMYMTRAWVLPEIFENFKRECEDSGTLGE